MASTLDLSTHRSWEDWLSIALGAVIAISPWLAGAVESPVVVIHAIIVGLLVLSLAGMERVVLRASEEWLELACGAWLIAAPWIMGYRLVSTLASMHVVLGIMVAALALLELGQDGRLTRAAA